jgi:hypothetical protein
VAEAEEEHAVVERLASQLKRKRTVDEDFEAKFKVMAENVKHHIEEEEMQMLPMAAEEGMDRLRKLGEEMQIEKARLMGASRNGARSAKSSARGKTRTRTKTAARSRASSTRSTTTRKTTTRKRTGTSRTGTRSASTRKTSSAARTLSRSQAKPRSRAAGRTLAKSQSTTSRKTQTRGRRPTTRKR